MKQKIDRVLRQTSVSEMKLCATRSSELQHGASVAGIVSSSRAWLPWSSSSASAAASCAERLPHIPLKLVQAGSRFQ